MIDLQRYRGTSLVYHRMLPDDEGDWVRFEDVAKLIAVCMAASKHQQAQAYYDLLRFSEEPRDDDAIHRASLELTPASAILDHTLVCIGDKYAKRRLNEARYDGGVG